jgi:hypothetical protein
MKRRLRSRISRVWEAISVIALFLVAGVDRGFAQERVPVDAGAILKPGGGAASQDVLDFDVNQSALEALSALHSISLGQFPLTTGETVTLDLDRFWVWGPGTQFVIGTDHGDKSIPAPPVIFFRGRVAGDSASKAFLSASPFGINAIVRVGEHQYFLSPANRGANRNPGSAIRHTLFDGFSQAGIAPPAQFECNPLTPPGQIPVIARHSPDAEIRGASRVALIALEADHEFRLLFGSDAAAAAYACELLAAVSFIYETDLNVKLAASFVRIWDTPADPYDGADTESQLEQFRVFWNANMGSVQRNVAHFLSGRALGGGLAYIDVMCNGANSYGVSANLSGTFPRPLQDGNPGNWDLIVVAHELGHNFCSPHTHCYDPPVDRCYTEEDSCAQGTQVCQQGTIMSYCHLCTGGVANIDLTFGPTVISFIQSGLRSCIGLARNPCFVNAAFSGSEQGTSSNPYRTIAKGTWFVAPRGSVSIAAGDYPEQFRICQPMTLVASSGTVTIGN